MERRSLQISKLGRRFLSVAALASVLVACSHRTGWRSPQVDAQPVSSVSAVQMPQIFSPGRGLQRNMFSFGGAMVYMVSPSSTLANTHPALVQRYSIPVRPPAIVSARQAVPVYPVRVNLYQRSYPPMGLPPEPVIPSRLRKGSFIALRLPVPSVRPRHVQRLQPKTVRILRSTSERKSQTPVALVPQFRYVRKSLVKVSPAIVKKRQLQDPQPESVGVSQTKVFSTLIEKQNVQAQQSNVVKKTSSQADDEPQVKVFPLMVEERNLPTSQPLTVGKSRSKVVWKPQSQVDDESQANVFPSMIDEQNLLTQQSLTVGRSQSKVVWKPQSQADDELQADVFPLMIEEQYLPTQLPRAVSEPQSKVVQEPQQQSAQAVQQQVFKAAQQQVLQALQQQVVAQAAQVNVFPVAIEEQNLLVPQTQDVFDGESYLPVARKSHLPVARESHLQVDWEQQDDLLSLLIERTKF